jgi:hypothetical protein
MFELLHIVIGPVLFNQSANSKHCQRSQRFGSQSTRHLTHSKSYRYWRDTATAKAYHLKFPLTPIRYLVQAEIDDMLWEVDEDCDRAVKWPEFQQMYHRCRHDKTGEMQIGMLNNIAEGQNASWRYLVWSRARVCPSFQHTTDLPHQARRVGVHWSRWYQQLV